MGSQAISENVGIEFEVVNGRSLTLVEVILFPELWKYINIFYQYWDGACHWSLSACKIKPYLNDMANIIFANDLVMQGVRSSAWYWPNDARIFQIPHRKG